MADWARGVGKRLKEMREENAQNRESRLPVLIVFHPNPS